MQYETILNLSQKECRPKKGMLPFSHVWQENRTLLTDGILLPSAVGTRCGGYFCFSGDGDAEQALAALRCGLESAFFSLAGAAQTADASLFTERTGELLSEINRSLGNSDSPIRIEEILFAQADRYVRPQNPPAGRYSGFIIGQSGTRQVTVYAPLGIEGEWQCVCGKYNEPKKRKCAGCRTSRPRFKA